MTMRKILGISLIALLATGCGRKEKGAPDISGVKVDVKLGRFDRDFFALDTSNFWPSLRALNKKYPEITGIFIQNVLGLDSSSSEAGIKHFIKLSQNLHDTVNAVFRNTDDIERDFKKGFGYVKYYFPGYKTPANIITIAGPVDAMAQSLSGPTPNFLGPDFLGISLQFYLGKNFSVYNDAFFIENVAPGYRSRRFSKEYLVADAMQLIVDDIYPGKSGGKALIEQMVEKGKRWYLLDKFLPHIADSAKTGYTQAQLDWCKENEGLIWTYIIKNEDLYSLIPSVIQTYIGEAPYTPGFSPEYSPGNIGAWIGWQIVKKYVSKNSGLSPDEVMKTDPKKILDEAKYKPK